MQINKINFRNKISKKINYYIEISQSIFRKMQQQKIKFFARITITLYLNILYINKLKIQYNKNITNLV